jgi:hypothetical protein
LSGEADVRDCKPFGVFTCRLSIRVAKVSY